MNYKPLLLLGFSLPALSAEVETYPDTFNDWVISSAASSVCAGYYVPPKFSSLTEETENLPLDISADYSSLSTHGNSMLMGNVLVERGNMRMVTDQLTYYRDQQTKAIESATAQGGVLVEEPQVRLYGNEARLNLVEDRLDVDNAQFRLYPAHARGSARFVEQKKDEPIYLYDASYTTCAPNSNVWEVRAKEVVLNQESNRGEAYHAWVYVKDIPIAYTPYLNFPLSDERKSGFLSPNYANSNSSGFEFSVPYYFNLAPNYDATLVPVWYSERGYQTLLETRYLFHQARGTFYAEWLPHDPAFADFRDDRLAGVEGMTSPQIQALESAGPSRGAIYWENNSQLTSQWLLDINYEYVSDDNYVSDLSPAFFDLNNRTLERQLQTEYYSRYWEFSMRVLDYQNLQPYEATTQIPSYNVLPQLFLGVDYPGETAGLNAGFDIETSIFTHEDELFVSEPVTHGDRYVLIPNVDWTWQRPYAYFEPELEYTYTEYDVTLIDDPMFSDFPTTPSRSLPIFNIDSGMYLDRNIDLFGSDYSQTLEPRLFYLYVPYRDQNDLPNFDSYFMEFNYAQLFRKNRFTGLDRISDANQLSYALSSRFINDKTGMERSRLSLGQIYYFDNRHVTICDTDLHPECFKEEDPYIDEPFSPFASEYMFRFNQQWSGSVELIWNPYSVTEMEQQRVQLNYQQSPDFMFNLGYSFIYQGNPVSDEPVGSDANNLDQVDGAFSWRFDPRWKALAGIEYDVTNKFSVENFGGIEYENCCWALRVGARRYLTVNSNDVDQTFDEEIFIQWSFKGLANVGNGPEGLFAANLSGYQDDFGKRY